jgi:hypothetical protein
VAGTKSNGASAEATFHVEKDTKNSVRFEENLESEFAAPKFGTIYVPKATLGAIGFESGKEIRVTVEVVG